MTNETNRPLEDENGLIPSPMPEQSDTAAASKRKKRFLALGIAIVLCISAVLAICLMQHKKDDPDHYFKQGLLAVTSDGKKWGYINEKGEYVIEPQFDEAKCFWDNGLAWVQLGGKWGCIDEKGRFVVEPRFDEAWNFSDNGLAWVQLGGKWGCIDEKGRYVVEPRFDDMHFVDQAVTLVCVGDLWGYVIEEEGQCVVIEPQFDDACGFDSTGIACVRVGDLWGFIDKNGHYVIEPQFRDYSSY